MISLINIYKYLKNNNNINILKKVKKKNPFRTTLSLPVRDKTRFKKSTNII